MHITSVALDTSCYVFHITHCLQVGQNPVNAAVVDNVLMYRYGRPARCVLDRRTDMQITGYRRPYLAKYKVTSISGVDIFWFTT